MGMLGLESCQQSDNTKIGPYILFHVCASMRACASVCYMFVRRKDLIWNITTFSPVFSMTVIHRESRVV